MSETRSTFPLDDLALARQVLRQIITDPISWVPLLPPVALYSFFDLPGWIPLALGVGISGGLLTFWKKQWPQLHARQQQIAIREHNATQDALLAAVATQFSQQGHSESARWLNRFLRLKQKIENRIHESGGLTSQKIQLERLVDALCFEARDQLVALNEKRADDFSSLNAAYETLEAAAAQIDNLLGPGETLPGPTSNLAEITSRLREETEIARRVQERLKQTTATETFPPPENPQSQ